MQNVRLELELKQVKEEMQNHERQLSEMRYNFGSRKCLFDVYRNLSSSGRLEHDRQCNHLDELEALRIAHAELQKVMKNVFQYIY